MSLKISTDNNGNRTRDLPTCSAVPQPTDTAYPNETVGIYSTALYKLEGNQQLGGRKWGDAMKVDLQMTECKFAGSLRLYQQRAQNNRLRMKTEKNRKPDRKCDVNYHCVY
jgi:hypothetical protein